MRDPDIFFTGADGSLRSNRAFCQTAGLYACDMFIGSTLQIDLQGNSLDRDRRRASPASAARRTWARDAARAAPSERALAEGRRARPIPTAPALLRRGRKLVVQIGETFGDKNVPLFVEKLDAVELAEKLKLELAPVMIYGDDVTHIVTEEGIANLLLCRDDGRARTGDPRRRRLHRSRPRAGPQAWSQRLRERGVIRRPEDLGINPLDADRSLLAARSIKDLVHWSGGLYAPPSQFRNW